MIDDKSFYKLKVQLSLSDDFTADSRYILVLLVYEIVQVINKLVDYFLEQLTSEEGNGENSDDDEVFNIDAKIKSVTLHSDSINIPAWVQHIECPFNWLQVRFPDVSSKDVINKMREKTDLEPGLNDTFPFEK